MRKVMESNPLAAAALEEDDDEVVEENVGH